MSSSIGAIIAAYMGLNYMRTVLNLNKQLITGKHSYYSQKLPPKCPLCFPRKTSSGIFGYWIDHLCKKHKEEHKKRYAKTRQTREMIASDIGVIESFYKI